MSTLSVNLNSLTVIICLIFDSKSLLLMLTITESIGVKVVATVVPRCVFLLKVFTFMFLKS